MSEIHDIFDRASKRYLSLSKRGTVMLINSLYGKDYPLDSQVDYNWTEHEDGDLRKTLADTPENLEQLKELIRHDIIGMIQKNVAAGNLTLSEGRKLKQITLQLYRHIYKKYAEMEKEGVNTMVEEALILDIDVIEMEHKRELQKKDAEIREKDKVIQELTAKLKDMELSTRKTLPNS